jgi:hypothetical protein
LYIRETFVKLSPVQWQLWRQEACVHSPSFCSVCHDYVVAVAVVVGHCLVAFVVEEVCFRMMQWRLFVEPNNKIRLLIFLWKTIYSNYNHKVGFQIGRQKLRLKLIEKIISFHPSWTLSKDNKFWFKWFEMLVNLVSVVCFVLNEARSTDFDRRMIADGTSFSFFVAFR